MLYIRHAEKSYRNGDSCHKLTPSLSDKSSQINPTKDLLELTSLSNRDLQPQSILDPNITDNGIKQAHIRFRELLHNYGTPSQIISSPYLRTRETAHIARAIIFEEKGQSVDIAYEHAIGEYLGHHKHRNISTSLHPDTLVLKPIPPETWQEYSNRVRKYVNSSMKCGKSTSPCGDVWYITHGVVIQSIAFFFNHEKIIYPSELHGIRIDNNKLSII